MRQPVRQPARQLMRLFSALLAIGFGAQAVQAGGDSIGNGGVLWACRSMGSGRTIYSAVLTDLYEAQVQWKLSLLPDPGGDPMQIYLDRKMWLQKELPDMFRMLDARFQYVEQHLSLVRAELVSTNDFNNVLKPEASTCPQGEWQSLNIANFREEDQVILLSSELWNGSQVPALHKAALLFHEAVYYWLRTYLGVTNSDKARRITGILFSKLSPEEMKAAITRVLGSYPDQPEGRYLCIMKNSKRNQMYIAFADSEFDASISVRLRCQEDPEAGWCSRASLECEPAGKKLDRRCIAENSATGKLYQAPGRSLIEAQFNAHTACFVGSRAQGGQEQNCPETSFMECN